MTLFDVFILAILAILIWLLCPARKRCKARSCRTKTPRGGPGRFADEETGEGTD